MNINLFSSRRVLLPISCLMLACTLPLSAAPRGAANSRKAPTLSFDVAESELADLRSAAESGDASAQVKLGHYYMTHYEEGYTNEQVAGDWFRRAAESGDASGQAWYAVYLWAITETSAERIAQALPWAEKAAEQGNTLAEYLMGKLTYQTERDTAISWFRKAARKGFMPAQRDLAYTLLTGNHFEDKENPEVKEAHRWIAKAVRSGDPLALMMAGGHPHRSTKNTLEHKWEHPVKKSIKFVRKAVKSSHSCEWKWYGSLVDAYVNYGRCHGKGGSHYWVMTQAYVDMRTLYRFAGMDKEAKAVPMALVNTLKKRVKSDPVAANLALAELFQHWSTLYFHELPCPEDYTIYAARAAEAEGTNYDDPRLRKIAEGMATPPAPAP